MKGTSRMVNSHKSWYW